MYVLVCVKIYFEQSMFLHFSNLGQRTMWNSMKWHHQVNSYTIQFRTFSSIFIHFSLESNLAGKHLPVLYLCTSNNRENRCLSKVNSAVWDYASTGFWYRGIEADVQLYNSRGADILDGPILLFPCVNVWSWGPQ